MSTTMKRRLALSLALVVGAVGLTAVSGTAIAGSGTAIEVKAVKRQPFSGTIASYTSAASANRRFAAQMYLDVLGRMPEASELDALDGFLGSGATRTQAADSQLSGAEYRAALTASAYETFLHRQASATELAFAVSMLGAGESDEELDARLIGSTEYLATRGGGTIAGFLDALYLDVLGRPLDPESAVVLEQALAVKTRAAVALDVLTSLEARQRLVQALHERFLHRLAEGAEVQALVGVLQGGGTDEDVIAMLVGSAEYFGSLPATFASGTIDWGDGSPSTYVPLVADTVDGTHTYKRAGIYQIEIAIRDLDGVTQIEGTATVTNKR